MCFSPPWFQVNKLNLNKKLLVIVKVTMNLLKFVVSGKFDNLNIFPVNFSLIILSSERQNSK